MSLRIWFPLLVVAAWVGVVSPALAQQEENIFNPHADVGGKDLKPDERLGISAELVEAKADAGGTVTLRIKLSPADGFYTYPFRQDDPAVAGVITSVRVESPAVEFRGEVAAPPPDKIVPAPEFGAEAMAKWTSKITAEAKLHVKKDLATGTYPVKVRISTQVCDDSSCVPLDKRYEFALEVVGSNSAAAAAGPSSETPSAPPAVSPTRGITSGIDPKLLPEIYREIAELLIGEAAKESSTAPAGLWAFILSGALIGFISLLTPCVFPMIPITVSFFLKQSEKVNHRPVAMAAVYCGTIILVLTLSAMFLLGTVQALSQNAYMNFFIGLLFVFFALSLFGWYDIELPSSLTRFTSAREGQGGYAGTIFMALTFTIISFACVAPFLGGFAGAATQSRPWHELLLGALAFAVTFAAPFFLLALFPGMLRRLPRSGSWLNGVKVVMGFLELAAALKFLRAGELAFRQGEAAQFFTYDFVLALWIGISLLCAFYLLALYRLPHDSEIERLSVPRLMWATAFLGLAILMVPALFKHPDGERMRPAGEIFAWLDAFLLDEPQPGESWSANLSRSIEAAREHQRRTGQRRLVFVDFTGIICTNCRYNEHNIFPDPKVKNLLNQFELVQLVTDTLDDEGDANKAFQQGAFGTIELPLYAVLEPLPDGKIRRWGTVGGKINSIASFVEFLERPLQGGVGNGRLASQ